MWEGRSRREKSNLGDMPQEPLQHSEEGAASTHAPVPVPTHGPTRRRSYLSRGASQRAQSHAASTPLGGRDRHACLASVYHVLARQVDADRELELFKATAGDAAAYSCAEIDAQFGNKAAALHWLAKAEQLHDAALGELRVAPLLDRVRKEPEFNAIEARLNFPP